MNKDDPEAPTGDRNGPGIAARDYGGHLLEVRELQVRYGGRVTGVDGASMCANTGQLVGIVGPNGAGKTSLLRGITGFLGRSAGRVVSGKVFLRGEDITDMSPAETARAGVALVPERDKVFLGLTVSEHIRLGAHLRGRLAEDAVDQSFQLFPGLRNLTGRLARNLSGGERQMLALCTALCATPRLLLVDEASQGLAPGVVAGLSNDMRRMVDEGGLTMVVVEQNANVALDLCDYLYVMEAGRVSAEGTPDQLVQGGALQRAYLGI